MLIRTLLLIALLLPPLAVGGELANGGRLPALDIAELGELVISGDDVAYRPWSYPQEPGKVHIVQYMAATRSASEINKPFTDRMKTDLPQGAFLSTTILNLDEAMWGTKGFVLGELKSNKKQFPSAILVADEAGAGLKRWQLEEENSVVIVTDPAGTVRFFKQGAMSPAEIDSTLTMIRRYIGEAADTAHTTGAAAPPQ